MPWTTPLRPRYWSLKRLTILVGFLLTLLGSVGAYLYVEPAQKRAGDLDESLRTSAVTIETLKNAVAEYFMFEQQGSLIFAISAANTNEEARDVIGKLRQLALLDRTFAVRQILGQLAIAGQLDYRQTSDAYQSVIDAARKDFTLQTFLAVKGFERTYISRAETRSGELQIQRFNLAQQKAVADSEVTARRLVLLALATLGSAFLLAANLIATREEVVTQPAAAPLPGSLARPESPGSGEEALVEPSSGRGRSAAQTRT